jgi:protein-tyrosine kinase
MEETNEETQRVRRIKFDVSTSILHMGTTDEEGPNDETQVLKARHKTTLPQEYVEKEPATNGKVHTSPAPAKALPAVQIPRQPGKASRPKSKRLADGAYVRTIRERCRQVCLSIFFREHAPARSLGFTSSIAGEGKSFLTTVMANVLAQDSSEPVTLLECNWEHPCFHEYFGIPPTPGLAEWLRGECDETAIRHTFDNNLTVIPAGDGRRDAVKLLRQLQQKGLRKTVAPANDLLVVDLPSVIPSAYGALAASLVEALIIVIRAGVTTDLMVAETCGQLKGLPVEGVILNQMESRVPRWLRRLL